MDDKHYFEFAGMGVTACVLGYADDEVNQVVVYAISNGSVCTLNSYEEAQLVEKSVLLHSWSERVSFS